MISGPVFAAPERERLVIPGVEENDLSASRERPLTRPFQGSFRGWDAFQLALDLSQGALGLQRIRGKRLAVSRGGQAGLAARPRNKTAAHRAGHLRKL